MPAYPGRVVLCSPFRVLSFNGFWKFLRLGSLVWIFLGELIFRPGVFGVLLEALGSIWSFDFCPHSNITVTWNPKYSTPPPPPPPPPRLGAVLFVRSLMFGAVIFIFPQFRHFSGSSHCWNVDKLCDAASLTIVLIISPGMTPSSVCNPFYWLPGPKIKRVTLTSFRSNIAVTRNKYKVP